MQHQKRKRFTLAVVLMLSLVISSCSSSNESAGDQETDSNSRTVELETVSYESLSSTYHLAGTLEADQDILVSFEADGRVISLEAVEGDSVAAESPLARLESDQYELQLSRANAAMLQTEAAVSNAEAALEAAKAGVSSSEAQIRSAEANLQQMKNGAREQEVEQVQNIVDLAASAYNKSKTDLDRAANLYEQGLVTLNEYEKAQLSFSSAQKDLNNANAELSLVLEGATKEQLETASAGVEQAKAAKQSALASQLQAIAGMKQAEAAYKEALVGQEQAQLALSKATLEAPISGVILEKMIEVGQLTGAGQSAYRLGRIDQLKVLLPVPDNEINEWKEGETVNFELYNEERTGTVNKIYPSTNADTGSINVEVTILNPKLDWAPGQVVQASRQNSANKGITVPVEAVISSGNELYVFKAIEGKAVKTNVEISDMLNNRLIIFSGLNENDQIVVSGADLLFDGDSIQTAEGSSE